MNILCEGVEALVVDIQSLVEGFRSLLKPDRPCPRHVGFKGSGLGC